MPKRVNIVSDFSLIVIATLCNCCAVQGAFFHSGKIQCLAITFSIALGGKDKISGCNIIKTLKKSAI